MTWVQYWIPFVGFRDLPDEVAEAVGLDGAPLVKYSGFTLSWLGTSIVLFVIERDEQE